MKNKLIILFGLFVFSLSFLGCRFNNTSDVESISIKTEPTKTTYLVSEKFDPTGLVITATFGDNSTEDITYSEDSGITFKNSKFTTSGEKEITVVYCEKETTLKITVKPTLKSIEVKTEPTKLVYAVEDSFDPSGLVITANYSNSTTEDITYATDSGITLSTPDMTKDGTKTITVTYLEKETSFNITVKPVVKSITVKTNPTKATYTIDEKFDPAGLVITATYSNSTTEDITYSATSGITLSTPDMTAEGDKTITVTYLEKTASFTIAVQKKVEKIYKIDTATAVTKNNWFVEAIDVYAFGNKTVNISISAKMKVTNSGATANVTWATNADGSYPTLASSSFAKGTSDWVTVTGTKENVKLSQYPKIYISPYGLTAANLTIYVTEITVTITDGTTTKTYTAFTSKEGLSEITATDVPASYTPPVVLTSISVKTKPTKSLYEISDTALNLTGLVITETYDDGTTTDVTYSSTAGITTSSVDFSTTGTKTVTVTYKEKTATFTIKVRDSSTSRIWTDVVSLKQTFVDGGFFDRFGLACEQDELGDSSTAGGILYHSNTTTPGNELKPQFIFWSYSEPNHAGSFTASNGKTISVPTDAWMKTQMAIKMDPYLAAAKAAGIQIRGHVLTWHSQTPDFFFTENWAYTVTTDSDGVPTNLVDKETMTARHEWYIKTVLNHVAEWEAANGYAGAQTETASGKKHLIYSWDVVNETVSDSASDTDTDYLRRASVTIKDSDNQDVISYLPSNGASRWTQIYGNEEFAVNAFRFANAYAPSDVTLCYNDYNEYLNYGTTGGAGSWKTNGIVRLLTAIKNGEAKTINGKSVAPRIDAMAMQSHVEPSWMTVSAYEGALKKFLALDIDVQVTEFDIATTVVDDTQNWSNYFEMFLKYSKKGSEKNNYNGHHITGFTIWGLNDENSWISKGGTQYPLIFTKVDDEYIAKDCFYSVIDSTAIYE